MEKCYTVIISNSENHLYDKLLCNICNGYSNRNNFSRHKNSPRHLAYKKSGIITTNSNGEEKKKEIIAGKYYSVEPEEEEEEENKFLLSDSDYNKILDKIKKHNNSLEVDFLQSFFNQANEKGINTLWKFFRDRQTIINEEI
jgi:hypothetical protein